MKIIISLIGLFLCVSVQCMGTRVQQAIYVAPEVAQQTQRSHGPGKGPCDWKPEKFKKDLMAFIAREAGFTEGESRRFFPVFFEMHESQRNIERQKNRAFFNAAKQNMNERDCQRVLNEVDQLDKKWMRMKAQYNSRMRKIVGARKLVKAMDADRRFSRRMFKKLTK